MLVFNSINMVLLLNLIIAILSSTYAFFESKKTGLFYEVLVSKFAVMDFDRLYGSAACATPPLNMMIFPFQWVIIFDCWTEEFLLSYNEFLCHLLYMPLAVIFTIVFAVINVFCMPSNYIVTSYRLFKSAITTDELDENDYICEDWITFFKWLIFGPLILLVSLPADAYVFAYNLYTLPPPSQEDV
jgi:hypothetical protein